MQAGGKVLLDNVFYGSMLDPISAGALARAVLESALKIAGKNR